MIFKKNEISNLAEMVLSGEVPSNSEHLDQWFRDEPGLQNRQAHKSPRYLAVFTVHPSGQQIGVTQL